MRIESWLVALLPLFFCACGGDDGGDGDAPGNPPASGRLLWSVTQGVPYLRGIDTGTGEVEVDVQVAEGATEVFSIVPEDDQVWLGRDDGSVVVVGQSSGKVEKTLTVADSTTFVEQLAVGGGSAYFAFGDQVDPHVLRVGTRDFQTKADEPVVTVVDWLQGLLYDGESVFVLSGNEFAAIKLDPSTLATKAVAGLGADASDPNVLAPENYGVGFMTQVGHFLWVVDTDSNRLLRVDKRTMVATVTGDLSDLLAPGSATEIAANASDFFLALHETGKIVRFDGSTGARKRTYEPEGGVWTMAVSNQKLYVAATLAPQTIHEVDIESGKLTHTFLDQEVDQLAIE